MTRILIRLRQRAMDGGATMVEYGIMVALIAVVVIAAVSPLGQAIRETFAGVTGKIPTPAPAP
ncbi:MAG: Flp family type IVb pilin [Dermatophilaceae bacterium]